MLVVLFVTLEPLTYEETKICDQHPHRRATIHREWRILRDGDGNVTHKPCVLGAEQFSELDP